MRYTLPENIQDLDILTLSAEIDKALDAFNAIKVGPDSSDEDLDEAEAIKAAYTQLVELRTAKQVEVDEAEAKRTERLANLTIEPAAAPVEAPVEPAAPAAPAPAEPAAAAEPPVEPAPVEAAPVLETVAASASSTGSPVARAAAASNVEVPASRPVVSLVAAADVPGYTNGQELEGMAAVTAAILARTSGLSTTNLATENGGVRQRYGAALIRKEGYGEGMVQERTGGRDMELVWDAGDQARLPGGSLVAAGGWCAPSETLYDICQYETVEGILSIPEVQVNRGGLRWTPGPDFADIYAACGFIQTEAEAIAGDCKDCCMVDCPEFDEIRLDAIGLCVKSPLLTETAYPELTQRFVEGALVAHQHKVNKYIIDAIALGAGTPKTFTDTGSLSVNMEALVFQGIGMRYEYRMSQTAQIEVVLPFWVKELLKIDLAMQNDRDSAAVSDAEINAWFTARNFSVQWVYDFQDPVVAADHDVTIPGTATALMYPTGTWVKGSKDVIKVDAVYDSPNLEANQYTALFMEEGILAVQKCTHTSAVTIPICVSGKGVLDDMDVCLTAPAAA